MSKRKVTFQGLGNEDDEDEISVPKKKVRGPDSCILEKKTKKELGASRGKRLGGQRKDTRG